MKGVTDAFSPNVDCSCEVVKVEVGKTGDRKTAGKPEFTGETCTCLVMGKGKLLDREKIGVLQLSAKGEFKFDPSEFYRFVNAPGRRAYLRRKRGGPVFVKE